jgi:hypothetical protein
MAWIQYTQDRWLEKWAIIPKLQIIVSREVEWLKMDILQNVITTTVVIRFGTDYRESQEKNSVHVVPKLIN